MQKYLLIIHFRSDNLWLVCFYERGRMSGKSRITIANISANAKSQGKQHVQHDYVRENIEKFEENSKKSDENLI